MMVLARVLRQSCDWLCQCLIVELEGCDEVDSYRVVRDTYDGTMLDFRVSLDFTTLSFRIHELIVIPKGKTDGRKVLYELAESSGSRELTRESRRRRELAEILKFVSIDVVNEILLEAWYNMKPKEVTLEDANWEQNHEVTSLN